MKLLPYLSQSNMAANLFPLNIQVKPYSVAKSIVFCGTTAQDNNGKNKQPFLLLKKKGISKLDELKNMLVQKNQEKMVENGKW